MVSQFGVFQVRGFAYGVSGAGCRSSGFRFRVRGFGGSGFRGLEFLRFRYAVCGFFVFEVRGFWLSVQGFRGSGFRVRSFTVRVSGSLVFEVWGFWFSFKGF